MTKEMERFRGGSWDSAYTYLGAHPAPQGYTFRVWRPMPAMWRWPATSTAGRARICTATRTACGP